MNTNNDHTKAKRAELELKINDAADGLLAASEIKKLEKELGNFPDLHQDYLDIMGLRDLQTAYGQHTDRFRNDLHVHRIQNLVKKNWSKSASFEVIAITWFRQYGLAAAFLAFALTSLVHLFGPQLNTGRDEATLPELLYPYEESSAESYVIYLDELFEP